MLSSRCFTRLTCGQYSFSIWVKFLESTLRDTGYGVFTSGGEDDDLVKPGGVALFVKKGKLELHFKRTDVSGNMYYKWQVNGSIGEKQNEWIHVMGTWSEENDEVKLFVNGTMITYGQKTTYSPVIGILLQGMRVGQYNVLYNSVYGDIVIDEWYFWDMALAEEQIVDVYAAYQQGVLMLFCICRFGR